MTPFLQLAFELIIILLASTGGLLFPTDLGCGAGRLFGMATPLRRW